MELPIGKEYNLNNVKMVEITDDFLGIDENVRGCQNDEPYQDCITRHYIHAFTTQCKCLPFAIVDAEKVKVFIHKFK